MEDQFAFYLGSLAKQGIDGAVILASFVCAPFPRFRLHAPFVVGVPLAFLGWFLAYQSDGRITTLHLHVAPTVLAMYFWVFVLSAVFRLRPKISSWLAE